MTGIGGLLFESAVPTPDGGSSSWWWCWWWWKKIVRYIFLQRNKKGHLTSNTNTNTTQFVVLCFRRTGSNWLCGMLFNHPEILMHNELFNENGVHTYYKEDVLRHNWDYEGRDINPNGFLDFIMDESNFSKFRNDGTTKTTTSNDNGESKCKAVGYKSFPNHYLQHGIPLSPLNEIYQQKVLCNPNVRKIILERKDVIRTYLSSRRAFETGIYMSRRYDHYQIYIDVVDMQRFIDRYDECYERYDTATRGHHGRCWITYEALCQDASTVMKGVWDLLGVQQQTEPISLAECRPQSDGTTPLSRSIRNYRQVEFAYRYDHRLSKYFDNKDDDDDDDDDADDHGGDTSCYSSQEETNTNMSFENVDTSIEKPSRVGSYRWVLLIPVRAGPQDDENACRDRLMAFYNSLKDTTRPCPNSKPILLFGVDDDDEVYNRTTPLGENNILHSIFGAEFQVQILTFSGLKGRICKIWRKLALHAYTELDADFTCLMGDDVELHTKEWQTMIEQYFVSISEERELPFGAACVAFKDLAFPGFPTFPVVHRWHFDAMGGSLLPSQFENQGGDPFLFELYKRFGSSKFAVECSLSNTIGGKSDARYTKQRLRFEDDILTTAIRKVCSKLKVESFQAAPLHCMDVVVPTFRCDVEALERIVKLRASWPVQVSFWIVLDNPEHYRACDVRAMQTVADNYQVNVLEQFDRFGNPKNYGASAARNYGLGHCKADYAILLDDDVTPDSSLLDAYLGAAMRWPDASVLVGSTHFPSPHNLLTNAILASDIPGAYTIAERTRQPPWGVTANICVPARTSRLRFDLAYPKTGGGEDLDFCARARKHGPIRAVPGARAQHPWWHKGELKAIRQILGWAEGEVRCVGMPHLQEHIFWTTPNGVEMVALCPVLLGFASNMWQAICNVVVYIVFVLSFEILWHFTGIGQYRLRGDATQSFMVATQVRFVAAILIMMQEATRFVRALQNSPGWIFWRVDWHFGQNPYWLARQKRNAVLRSALYVLVLALVAFSNKSSQSYGGFDEAGFEAEL